MNQLFKFTLLSLCVSFNLLSQEVLVPIKVKDKFGLSDLNKTVRVEADYDKINFGIRPNYFVCFKKLEANSFLTSLMHYDKTIIKDKPYFDYGIYDDFIIAADTTRLKTVKYHNVFHYEKMQLYDLEGKLLYPDYYAFIAVFEDVSKIRKTSEIFVLFQHLEHSYTLRIYNKKKKEFTKTILDKVEDFDFVNNDQMLWALESMKLTYTNEGVYGKMEVKLVEGFFQITSHVKQTIAQKPKTYNDYYDDVELPEFSNTPKQKVELPKSDSISKTLKQVSIVGNHKDFTTTNYLYFENVWYRKKDYILGFKNGKVGLIDNKQGVFVLKPEYDAIYKMSGRSAFIIKRDDKYGVYFSYTKTFIKPIFKDLPVVYRRKYKGKGCDLIALFDTETLKLKYYATFKGDLFYIE
ncbi:hypothetical protein [Winogradskyella sp.]|jgi:hypothetical protein|uniref:hypothetical protein n=1 Tax=Winogradskyella sp. TaxID=1883156 RepID=UPI0025D31E0A|nr:hypothetical protein [Winogradskyella sp.]MCT4628538.1 hypothetical protein [Winogradskyella sp.]